MNCLTDYIGVIGCGAEVPDSGVYINSLPSINLRQLQGIADSEQENFLGVWANIQTRAQDKLLVDVSRRLRKRFKINSFIETFKLNENLTATVLPAAAELRGFKYDTQNNNGYSLKSNFYMTNVEYLKLFLTAQTTQPVDVYILDIDTGEFLFQKSILVADQLIGWNLIKVNKSFLNQRIKLVYNSTEVNSVSTDQSDLINNGCGCVNFNCGGELKGLQDVNETNDSYGLVGKISLTCTFEPVICGNKALFAGAFLYLLGAETMIERIYTERLNEFTTVGKDEAKELNNYFQSQYDEGMDNIIDGISISLNDCCISCNAPLRVVEQTP